MNPEDKMTTAIALVVLVMILGITTLPAAVQTTQGSSDTDHYNRGYGDGCNGINVPGHHSPEYLNGYAAGAAACHRGQPQPSPKTVCPYTDRASLKGYHDAENDFAAGKSPDQITQEIYPYDDYKAGYSQGWSDARNGVNAC